MKRKKKKTLTPWMLQAMSMAISIPHQINTQSSGSCQWLKYLSILRDFLEVYQRGFGNEQSRKKDRYGGWLR